MADPNIKQIQLTTGSSASGPATQQEGGGSRKRGQGAGRKNKTKKFEVTTTKEGGGSTSPGTLTQLSASHNPGDPRLPAPVGVNSPLTQQGAPVQAGAGTAAKAQIPVKVVLAAAKKKSKVVLAAAKPAAAVQRPAKTLKVSAARKIRVSMKGLSKKIQRARTIRQDASKSTVETIKKALQKAGLIKAESKAPETMLRQMYADFMTLKNRAL